MPVVSRTTDTYEYRKNTIRPRVFIRDVEMGECPESVFFKELKKIVNGRFYHTTDTNRFFFDWNNKRYELNLFGEGGGEIIDYSEFAKKTDIPKKTSQLTNDSGFITKTSLSDFLSRNKYVTEDMLTQSVSNLVGVDVFETLSSNVESINNEIEDIKRRIEEMSSDSDHSEELSELLRRVSVLEEAISIEDCWEEFKRE